MNTSTQFKKKNSQEFALRGGIIFNILAISGDYNAGGVLISPKNMFNMG